MIQSQPPPFAGVFGVDEFAPENFITFNQRPKGVMSIAEKIYPWSILSQKNI